VHLTITGSVVLDAIRSWHASLIMAELLTNSVRHACLEGEGRICVVVATDDVDIVCRISDGGAPPATIVGPGVGSHLVDALIDELRGDISRSYTKLGAVITLRFPMNPEGITEMSQRRKARPLSLRIASSGVGVALVELAAASCIDTSISFEV
jgi:two-component sensor histidine kinase